MRHVMKIGPVELAKGTTTAYVAAGPSGIDVALEATDEKGLAALGRKRAGEAWVCELGLSRIATQLGLAVAQPPPQALEIKAALAVGLAHGTDLERVAPLLVLDLIMAVIEFDAAEPWTTFAPDEPIAIRIEPGHREVEGCVIGQAGEAFGLALYHHAGSIDRVMALAAEGRPEAARSLACTTVLLTRDASCAVDAVRELTGTALAPLVSSLARGRFSAASEADVAALVAALRAITALARGETRHASGRTLEVEPEVVAHATRGGRGGPTRAAFKGVGRNEPCPCGSGKKFKRCHADAVEPPVPVSPRAALHAKDERIVQAIFNFGERRFGAAALDRGAQDAVGGQRASRQLVDPLLAYAWPIEGQPLAAHFLQARGASLATEDRTWIELQLGTRLSVWEILRVEQGKGVEAIDLLRGDRCFVHELMGSDLLAPRDAILARVSVGEVAVFCGMHESLLGPAAAEAIVASVRESALADGDWAATARLIGLWHVQLAAAARNAALPTTLTNTDGHRVVTVEDHFAITQGGFATVIEQLGALDDVIVDEHDRKGASLTFTRSGNPVHAWWTNTIVGSARVTPTRVVISTNSIERAESLRDRVRDALGELATWKKRGCEELPVQLGGERAIIDGQAIDLGAASRVDVFRAWLDGPLPTLDGRTPREAVQAAAGRRRVHVLVKAMEHQHARQPIDGFDPSQLRRELGLDELGELTAHHELDRAVGAGRKLSDTLLEFARPLLDVDAGRMDDHRLRSILGFAIHVWNLVVTEAVGSEAHLAQARAELGVDDVSAEAGEWFDRLVARKRERFHDDLRIVGNWQVRAGRGELTIEMEARLLPAVHAKLSAAGLVP